MSFTKNLVSIITPVYNGERYISRLLDSVLRQSWEKIEMILVDDGSTDNTVSVANNYIGKFEKKGYSLKVICETHVNASHAVSKGLKYVTGEYIIWPDGDDVLLPDSVKRRVEYLQDFPNVGAIRSLSRYVMEEDESIAERDEPIGDIKNSSLFFDILNGKTFVCCGCYMLRSNLFFELYPQREIPIYDVGQNFQMLLPYMYIYSCDTIEEELYVVYKRKDSHSRRLLSREQEEKKYSDYESLIDEIANIANISNEEDLQKIEEWKYKRRLYLARKYSDSIRFNDTVELMYSKRMMGTGEYIRKRISTIGNGRLRKVYLRLVKRK